VQFLLMTFFLRVAARIPPIFVTSSALRHQGVGRAHNPSKTEPAAAVDDVMAYSSRSHPDFRRDCEVHLRDAGEDPK